MNPRSLVKHVTELWDTIATHTPYAVFITEIWLNPASTPDITTATPNGYKIVHRDRINKYGGGIAIIHQNTLRCTTSTNDTTPIMEHLNFQLQTDGKTTIRGMLVYRPPGAHPAFFNVIPDFIAPLTIDSEHYIFLGDHNFHLDNTNDTNTADLLESLSNIGLKQLVTDPTHRAGYTIDPIFIASNRVKYSHTTELTWTDHHSVHFSITRPPNTIAKPVNGT